MHTQKMMCNAIRVAGFLFAMAVNEKFMPLGINTKIKILNRAKKDLRRITIKACEQRRNACRLLLMPQVTFCVSFHMTFVSIFHELMFIILFLIS